MASGLNPSSPRKGGNYFGEEDKNKIVKDFLDRLNFAKSDFIATVKDIKAYFCQANRKMTMDAISKCPEANG